MTCAYKKVLKNEFSYTSCDKRNGLRCQQTIMRSLWNPKPFAKVLDSFLLPDTKEVNIMFTELKVYSDLTFDNEGKNVLCFSVVYVNICFQL